MSKEPNKDVLQLCALWRREAKGEYGSAALMDDRVADLNALMQEGPVYLSVRLNHYKRHNRSPDAWLYAWRAK